MRRATRGVLVAITAGASFLVAPLVTGDPAFAYAPCGTTAADRDNRSWLTGANEVRLRSGSSTSCASLGLSYSNQQLDYHCYTFDNDGRTWTYLRNVATGKAGWSRDDNLPGNGSRVYCGF